MRWSPISISWVGQQGALHSLLTVGLLSLVLLLLERWYRGETTCAKLIAALLCSHLLLNFLDGGPVLVLYPLLDTGFGLHYPTGLVIEAGDTPTAVADRFGS